MQCQYCSEINEDNATVCTGCGAPLNEPPPMDPVSFNVYFGSAFAVDGFGFVRSGTLTVADPIVRIDGMRHISVWLRLLVWLLLTIVPFLFINLLGGLVIGAPITALLFIHYLCVSQSTVEFPLSSVARVVIRGRRFTFCAPNARGHFKHGLINLRSVEEAEKLKQALGMD